MTRSRLPLVLAGVAGAALWFLLPGGQVISQRIQEVFVTNFPRVQTVTGEVQVKGAVRLSEAGSFMNIVVPPVRRGDTTRLVEAGSLLTDGFPNVVLSLHGQVKGDVVSVGDVGAILIPEEETISQAFNELGLMHFGLEVVAPSVSADTPFFASNQPRYRLGFQSYRILLYNHTDKTVTASLYTYLTN